MAPKKLPKNKTLERKPSSKEPADDKRRATNHDGEAEANEPAEAGEGHQGTLPVDKKKSLQPTDNAKADGHAMEHKKSTKGTVQASEKKSIASAEKKSISSSEKKSIVGSEKKSISAPKKRRETGKQKEKGETVTLQMLEDMKKRTDVLLEEKKSIHKEFMELEREKEDLMEKINSVDNFFLESTKEAEHKLDEAKLEADKTCAKASNWCKEAEEKAINAEARLAEKKALLAEYEQRYKTAQDDICELEEDRAMDHDHRREMRQILKRVYRQECRTVRSEQKAEATEREVAALEKRLRVLENDASEFEHKLMMEETESVVATVESETEAADRFIEGHASLRSLDSSLQEPVNKKASFVQRMSHTFHSSKKRFSMETSSSSAKKASISSESSARKVGFDEKVEEVKEDEAAAVNTRGGKKSVIQKVAAAVNGTVGAALGSTAAASSGMGGASPQKVKTAPKKKPKESEGVSGAVGSTSIQSMDSTLSSAGNSSAGLGSQGASSLSSLVSPSESQASKGGSFSPVLPPTWQKK
eukprot:gnl/TRDRNA2_/TRDRNA2_200039_c0_seq1.p1 gnl/TRDRNA2_/TRDRNA2_200039_c0~~gnl/TRDRNA2_/TRDRNA2_200039_c0_seq1.p1  ORF type:complete len:531 (-),score=153.26 gnl/TRDRNA2_/TRDRNA2_200039_c0_seq1:37-1629(-)